MTTQKTTASRQVQTYKAISTDLERRIYTVEQVLPGDMKGQAARLIKRALLTFAKTPDLLECPANDFIRCVIEAAEVGLAIDGRLGYVVKYKNAWQFQPDYKGVVAVAKRAKQIVDCYADIVCKNDTFQHWRKDGIDHLEHSFQLGQDRGPVIGAYATVLRPDGGFRHEVMDRAELDRIQAAAPSKKGPWLSYPNEMRKKTVVRRLLKSYCDDPGVSRCLELIDREHEQPRADLPPTPKKQLHWSDDEHESNEPTKGQAPGRQPGEPTEADWEEATDSPTTEAGQG